MNVDIIILVSIVLLVVIIKKKRKNIYEDDSSSIMHDAGNSKAVKILNDDRVDDRKVFYSPSIGLLNDENIPDTSNEEIEKYTEIIEECFKLNGVEAYICDLKKGSHFEQYIVRCDEFISSKNVLNIKQSLMLQMGIETIIETVSDKDNMYAVKMKKSIPTEISVREFVLNGRASEGLIVGSDGLDSYMEFDYKKDGHLLIGGTTGSGKSTLIDQLLLSIIYKYTPEQVKLVLIDTSVIRLSVYNAIPHLLIPVITSTDRVLGALKWISNEMHNRFKILRENGASTLSEYERIRRDNKLAIPRLFVVIDDVGEVLMDYPEAEELLNEIARNGRIAGVHLILVTQKPIVCRVGALVKANISSRIAFRAASERDLDIILEDTRATRIVEDESFLYSKPGEKKLLTGYAAHIDFDEIERVVDSIRM